MADQVIILGASYTTSSRGGRVDSPVAIINMKGRVYNEVYSTIDKKVTISRDIVLRERPFLDEIKKAGYDMKDISFRLNEDSTEVFYPQEIVRLGNRLLFKCQRDD